MRFSSRSAGERSGGAPRLGLRRGLITGATACAAALALAACGSSTSVSQTASSGLGTDLYGQLPPVGTPTSGGVITSGQITGVTPTYIFPIIPVNFTTAYNFEFANNFWVPLYYGTLGARPETNYQISVAQSAPVPSNGDKTYTIHLKHNFTWSNGQPVTSRDVLFAFDLIKAGVTENPANWGQYTPGEFPTDVTSATTPDKYTIVFNLNKAYNPGYFLNNQLQDTNAGLLPLPSSAWDVASANGPHLDWTNPANAKKIYDFLSKQGGTISGFATNPLWKVVDGPFVLKDFNTTNSSFDDVANPKYTGPVKPHISEISEVTYTSTTAELNALKSGSLDIGALDPTELSQVPLLKRAGYTVFGSPSFGWFGGWINFADGANHFGKVISQVYARGVLYNLMNEPAIIKGVYKGAAVPQYGPVPSAPVSPYTPSDSIKPLYPYSPSTAVATLKAHGWHVVPNGTTTCAKAGTGPGECGAGIPAGTPFSFVWINNPPAEGQTGPLESEALASAAKQYAGINITFITKAFNEAQAYNDTIPQGKALINQWGINNTGGFSFDYYPTAEGVVSPGAPFNEGDFNDPTATKLMTNSVYSTNPNAVKQEAAYFAKAPYALYFPDPDGLIVVSKKLGGTPNSWLSIDNYAPQPQYWYLTK